MARSRNIKPGIFQNEILGVADPVYTLAFQGLWLLADREGRLEDRPLRIGAQTFPYRQVDMNLLLDWLQTERFILRYQVGDKRYIQVLNFAKHQNPHKNETESEIPAPEEIGTCSEIIGSAPADSLLLIPDSLIKEEAPSDARTATPSSPPSDPKKTLFDLGVSILTKTGDTEKSARSFLAKFAKQDEGKLGEVLGHLAAHPKVEPKSYIAAAFKPEARELVI